MVLKMRKIYMFSFARETLAHCVVRQKASFAQRLCHHASWRQSGRRTVEEEGVEDCQAWRCVARIGGTRSAAAFHRGRGSVPNYLIR